MKDKYKLIALVGESATGKDTLLKEVLKNDKDNILNGKISYTTRPKRDYEVDGKDYNFVDTNFFLNNINDFFEISEFNGWYYGTMYKDLSIDKINIGVFNLEGLKQLSQDRRINCYPIYITASDKVRLIRSLQREKEPNIEEIFRRYNTDKVDFRYIKDYVNLILRNECFIDKEYNRLAIAKVANDFKNQ